jgi:hypothetical protein
VRESESHTGVQAVGKLRSWLRSSDPRPPGGNSVAAWQYHSYQVVVIRRCDGGDESRPRVAAVRKAMSEPLYIESDFG